MQHQKIDSTCDLTCYYQNVRGLNTKVTEFYSSVSECEFDVIALSETWLHCDVSSSELFPDSYVVCRKDRKFQRLNQQCGGGVLLAFKSHIKSEVLDVSLFDMNFPAIDFLAVKCSINFYSFFILALYIPPSISINEFELFFEFLEQFEILQAKNIVLLGDLNAPFFVNFDANDRKSNCVKIFLVLINVITY